MPVGLSTSRSRTPHVASTSPSAPPITDSKTLSVRSWRSSRPRAAPSALRTAISACRAFERARSRFAMFAHAMSSTNTTAPRRITSGLRTLPTIASRIDTAVIPIFAL